MALGNGTTRNGANLDLDLNRVAVFVRIVDAKGVSAAASRGKLPKSSVSRALTQLEDELGVELIVRRSRTFQLTEAGQVFYDAAAKGIATLRDAREELRPNGAEPRGSLRVAAPPGFASLIVSPTIVAFVRRHPGVDVELCVGAGRSDPRRVRPRAVRRTTRGLVGAGSTHRRARCRDLREQRIPRRARDPSPTLGPRPA